MSPSEKFNQLARQMKAFYVLLETFYIRRQKLDQELETLSVRRQKLVLTVQESVRVQSDAKKLGGRAGWER